MTYPHEDSLYYRPIQSTQRKPKEEEEMPNDLVRTVNHKGVYRNQKDLYTFNQNSAWEYIVTHQPAEWKNDINMYGAFIQMYGTAARDLLLSPGVVPENMDRTWVAGPQEAIPTWGPELEIRPVEQAITHIDIQIVEVKERIANIEKKLDLLIAKYNSYE